MDGRIVYEVELHDNATRDIRKHHKAGNKLLVKRIYNFLSELNTHPRTGTGKPECLKGYKIETWSRRIDQEHRLIYEIHEGKLKVLAISAHGHYGDK